MNDSRKKINADAIPSIFRYCSSYLSKNLPPCQNGSVTSEMQATKVEHAAKKQENLIRYSIFLPDY